MQTLRLGWRNLWRNRRRTAITLAAVVFATAVLVMTDALLRGMTDGMLRNATDIVVGEAEVHAPGYLASRSFYDVIDDAEGILERADAEGIPAAPRRDAYGLVARGTKSAGAQFRGLVPQREARTSKLATSVREGRFLGDAAAGEMVLGRKLARTLGAGPGDEIVVVVQAADGSLGNELFQVAGILGGVGESLDRGGALIHADDFERLFVADGMIHEIAFNTHGAIALDELRTRLERIAPTAEVSTWRDLLPMVSDMTRMIDGVLVVLSSIFFAAAGLGVLNTLLMATYERIPELGVLKALGTSPLRIVGDLLVEAAVLGVLGAGIGGALGALGSAWFERHGIDTSAFGTDMSFAGVVWDPVWRATLSVGSVVLPVVVMTVVCVVAALHPAIVAARLDPVAAMRRS